jgi:hypothetical protein
MKRNLVHVLLLAGPVSLKKTVRIMHRQELSMPPTITLEQATGFGLFMIKAVLNGRGDEIFIEEASESVLPRT